MNRLAVLWRRPLRPTPWAWRLTAFWGGFALWAALQLRFEIGGWAYPLLPIAAMVAVELWWQPQRAERRPLPPPPPVPEQGAPRDRFKDPAHYRGRGIPGPEVPVALVWFVVPLLIYQATLALYWATDEDPLVLIAYGALLVGALGVALVRRARSGDAGS